MRFKSASKQFAQGSVAVLGHSDVNQARGIRRCSNASLIIALAAPDDGRTPDYATTIFTIFFGTTMIFLIALPSMNCCTFSDALARASIVA